MVDDYDLVATAANPLSRVLEFVAQGHDLGFHLILSGDRGEGPLLGTSRATTFPPGRGLLIRRKEQPVRVQVAWTQ